LLSVGIVSAFFLNWQLSLIVLISFLTFIYFSDLLFNFYLIYKGYSKSPEIKIKKTEIGVYRGEWPMYTILCPLYKEWKVIPQFIESIQKIEYSKDKLQVLLLLEEDDIESISKIKEFRLPSNFEVVIVPHSYPKTKPKACNFGLKRAKGEYVVIYDAEDIPDPLQLKKVILAFREADEKVTCIQAKLNFYNPRQNFLTRLFTAEYSVWFDLVLTGLQAINAPIPLGGTSNHFKTEVLKSLGGWDSFNVTEDCDLGMRLVKRKFKTAVLDSTTQEEANSNLFNWFRQRSRWIKGYIQTYFVHMRNPKEFITHWSEPHVITFQLIVGGKVISMLINPFMWILTVSYFVLRPFIGSFIDTLFPGPILYMSALSLIFGNFLYMYYYMIGCAKRQHDDLVKYVFFTPLYWLGMSVAAFTAIVELMYKPHYWSKTKHGLHLDHKAAKKNAVVGFQTYIPVPNRNSL
jgi:cellulose synthase/poly-beta-1,6-N-acetylglucosamine synthase-like glycosyltransferase